MNGELGGTPTARPLKNVDQMDKGNNPYKNGIPKDLSNGSKEHWIADVDEKQAEESLSLYCKPVELYNIIQQRCEQQPLFLQRCLSYKINAALQRRIRMTVSIAAYVLGKGRGRDPGTSNGVVLRSVFVMVTRPVTKPSEGQVVYQLRPAQVLTLGANFRLPSEECSPAGVTFILPELRKLVQNAKNGDVVLFIVCDSVDVGSSTQVAALANSTGSVVWGKLSISTLCLGWLRHTKDSSPRESLDGNGVGTTSPVDLRHGTLQFENSAAGRNIKISTTASTTDRSLVQLQVRIHGGEVGQTVLKGKGKAVNGTHPQTPLPYSLSHAWRPRVGRVVFHYLYYHGMLRKTEVTEDFSCPFCLNGCASFKGLRGHLNASHDLFNFEYLVSGELQVINVTCPPDMAMHLFQGTSRDIDGQSDPRVKNFAYWYRGSHLRRRKVPVFSGEHLQDGRTPLAPMMVETPQLAIEPDSQQGSDLHEMEDLNEEGLDATIAATEVADASGQQLDSIPTATDTVPNGLAMLVPNGILDGTQTKELALGDRDMTSVPEEQKSLTGKPQETAGLGQVVRQRSVPVEKRQRMKGVLRERAHARSRPRPTFGGACASAGGGLDLDDCRVQQGSALTNKGAADRPDIPRTHALLQKRQYFHSHTAQPMDADQLFGDRDSEDEVDTDIADLEDRRMLDDFVDVTSEEKEVMHLWNSFVRRNRVVADGHCPWACEQFCRENAQRFGENMALRRCLMLFLVKLWNHHLVDGPTISQCLMIVDSFGAKEQEETKK